MNWAYTLTMIGSMVCCSLLLRRYQQRLALPWWQKAGIGLGAFCGAMIGAKLPFALSDWEGLRAGTVWFAHGKTILCGIVGGYFGVEYAKWVLDVRVKTGDTFAVPVAIGVAIGRVGCFVGSCCYGTPTDLPWGVVFPHIEPANVARHPTQLYEFAFHMMMAAILFWLQMRRAFQGQLVKLYIIAYLVYRFATEFIRPEAHWFAGLTAYQYGCLVLLPVFVWLWRRDAQAKPVLGQGPVAG